MSQGSLSELEHSDNRKQTLRNRFLGEIDPITPWAALLEPIEPYYPQSKHGHPPTGLERMLRMYMAQQCFNLSDEVIEDAMYASQAIRSFFGIHLSRENAPAATTLLQFRRLLRRYRLTRVNFDRFNAHLTQRGLLLHKGTVADTTLIAAPPPIKNEKKRRAPEMRQTKTGVQCYFTIKPHIGAHVVAALVHPMRGTAANISGVSQVPKLLHNEEASLHGDAGFLGPETRPGGHRLETHIAQKRRTVPAMPEGPERAHVRAILSVLRGPAAHDT